MRFGDGLHHLAGHHGGGALVLAGDQVAVGHPVFGEWVFLKSISAVMPKRRWSPQTSRPWGAVRDSRYTA